ncbi:MAG: hypothetical protein JW900_08185 [Anaerolineae bacterium]|nr:hypothetical protein [Anaerolineae bacterium]
MILGLFAAAIQWLWKRSGLLILLILILVLVEADGSPPAALSTGVERMIADLQFHFWSWEVDAVRGKFTHWLLQPQRYMEDPDRNAFVRDYMERIGQIQGLRWQIETIYADPAVDDPGADTAEMRERLGQLLDQAQSRQPIAEAIIEEQVGFVLVQEGLGLLGQPFPPVGVRFTPLPCMLVVSPRDRIATVYNHTLVHGLNAAQQEAVEGEIDERFDVSSLVTHIGGLSAWPAMLLESSYLPWVQEVAAHEWTHHYLEMFPLGWAYEQHEARTINETTASIVGYAVGRTVLARYYPDLLPPEVEPSPSAPPPEPPDPPPFDFRLEMRETRVEVDRLLAEGAIDEAETYMEMRRQFFWENGYQIRKLNQAYFAFHGSYADEPGAAGEDPIGPAVRQLWDQSPSLRAFLSRINGVTTLAQLQAALEQE